MDQIGDFLRLKRWVYTLLVTTLFFIITYLKFGCYYVEYEGLDTGLISGKLTPGLPFKSFFFIGNFGLSYIYSYIYTCFPHIEWLSYFFAIYLFTAVYLGLYIVSSILPKSLSLWAVFWIELASYILVFMDHNINLIYTRVSYLICAMGLYSLLVLFKEDGSITKKRMLFLTSALFYLVGALTRIEASVAVLLLLVCFGLFYYDSFIQLAKVLILPVFITLSLAWYAGNTVASIKEFYAQVEPDIEAQYLNRNNMIPLSEMKNKKDSAMYKAASCLMWSDPEIMTPAYLRSLIKKDENPLFLDMRQWQRVCETDIGVLSNNKALAIVCVLLEIMAFMNNRVKGKKVKNLLLLAWLSSFWALIIIQTYVFKLNDRSFIPLISVFIFGHILLLSGSFFNRFSISKIVAVLIATPLLLTHLYNIANESSLLKEDWLSYKKNYDAIKAVSQNGVLVLNASSFDYVFLANKPFNEFDVSIADKIYIIDGYTIPFMPYYRAYLEKECNCNLASLPSLIKYLESRKDHLAVLSGSSRINIMRDYLSEVRSIDLKLTPDTTIQLKSVQKGEDRSVFEHLILYHMPKE